MQHKEALLAKKHDINMIAQWAKEYGIKGYDHLDPKNREQHRINTAKRMAQKERGDEGYKKHKV